MQQRRRRQSGQAIVLSVVFLVGLMGMAALGVDVGVFRVQRSQLQTIADGAALSGAAEIAYGDVATGAANDAALNGFVSGSGGAALTVNYPPQSGPHAGNSAYVEVIATRAQPTFFMKVFGMGSLSLSARAVGYLGSGTGCAYALDPTAAGAVLVNGTFNIQLQCAMYVDSKSGQALEANGSGTLAASAIGVVGGTLENGPVVLRPAPVEGMVPQGDPLGYLDPPSSAGPCASPTIINGSSPATLYPGVYCSTMIINGSPKVTFTPGVYVFKSGIIMNGTPTLTGNGVMLYNAGGSFTLNGSSTSNLSAPTTGPYAGILFFQSRSDSAQVTVNGSNASVLNGAIYAPAARIVDNGSGTASAYSILVGDTITINGSAALHDDYSSLPGGSPIKAAVLVE